VAQRVGRGIALLFHDLGTRREGMISSTPRPQFTPGKDPVPIVQKAGWAPGPVWTDAENLAAIGIRSPNRPARSQSLHRLSYRAHKRIGIYVISGSRRKVDRTALFWAITQRIVVISCRRFGTTCRSHLQGWGFQESRREHFSKRNFFTNKIMSAM
jgi:hypothetical protein